MATIDLFGPVGDDFDGFTVDSVSSMIGSNKGDLTVRINSPGGFVNDGIAIYNLLKDYKPRVEVVGLAASAASVIAMAGREIVMRKGASMMIHEAWAFTMGKASDHYKGGDTLTHLSKQIAGIYAERSGKPVEEMQALMAAETWLDADYAVSLGLATGTDSKTANKQQKNAAVYLGLMGCKTTEPPDVIEKAEAALRKTMIDSRVKNALIRS